MANPTARVITVAAEPQPAVHPYRAILQLRFTAAPPPYASELAVVREAVEQAYYGYIAEHSTPVIYEWSDTTMVTLYQPTDDEAGATATANDAFSVVIASLVARIGQLAAQVGLDLQASSTAPPQPLTAAV